MKYRAPNQKKIFLCPKYGTHCIHYAKEREETYYWNYRTICTMHTDKYIFQIACIIQVFFCISSLALWRMGYISVLTSALFIVCVLLQSHLIYWETIFKYVVALQVAHRYQSYDKNKWTTNIKYVIHIFEIPPTPVLCRPIPSA